MGVGFPRTGHRKLTVLLAFTVTSSTSSCVSPRITGGAGKERRKRQGVDAGLVEHGGGEGSFWHQMLARGPCALLTKSVRPRSS